MKTCSCGRSYDWAAFDALPKPTKGDRQEAPGMLLILRNCPCGSTISFPLCPGCGDEVDENERCIDDRPDGSRCEESTDCTYCGARLARRRDGVDCAGCNVILCGDCGERCEECALDHLGSFIDADTSPEWVRRNERRIRSREGF